MTGTSPSVSVPCLNFFGLPHGRLVPYVSALTTVHEGRGFNAYIPMPFTDHLRIELANSAVIPTILCYQIDYTLEPTHGNDASYLHVAFRREPHGPTAQLRDRRGPRRAGALPGLQPRRACGDRAGGTARAR